MEFKKTHFLLAAFIIFWILFLGWGMMKTKFKLAKGLPFLPQENKTESVEQVASEPVSALLSDLQTEASPILVRTFKVKTTDFRDILPVMGTAKGKTQIELRFEMNGVIKKWNFREGEKVKKGDLIVSLDAKDAQLKVEYARSKLNTAQANYKSLEKKLEVHRSLYEAGAIIKTKLEEVALEAESAKFQIETAKSEMALAENELTKTNFYANKDGVMGPREKEEGEFTTPQDKVGILYETSDILIEVGIVERDIDKIKIGQTAKIFVDAYPNTTFEGTIDSIYPVVEGKTRTLTAKIKIPNALGLLMPGMFSRAEINICELKDAYIIPATALIPTGGSYLLPVIPSKFIKVGSDEVKTGVVQLIRVTTGYLTSDYAQITEGINTDDLVVIETQGELKDNAKVRIIGVEELTF
jgi:membrane fusion protein (multidrug efflux system)